MIKAKHVGNAVSISVDGTGDDLLHEYVAITRMIADKMRQMEINEQSVMGILTACIAASLDDELLTQEETDEMDPADLTDLLKAAMKEFEK